MKMEAFDFYSRLPRENYVGKSIPLEDFLRFGDIGPAAQRDFRYYFVSARIMFVFKDTDGNSNHELHVIEFRIINQAEGWMKTWSVVKSFIQSIPYHILLVFREGKRFRFYIADFHKGIRKIGKHVVDRLICTPLYHEERKDRHDTGFYHTAVRILTGSAHVNERFRALQEAVKKTLENSLYVDRERDSLDKKVDEEYYLSKRELERDREFGHVPYDWLYEYGIAPIKTLFEVWKEDNIEEEWD